MTRRILLLLFASLLLVALSGAIERVPRLISTVVTPSPTAGVPPYSTGDGPMPPQTLAEWIKGANVIVAGTVVRVVNEGYTAGFDPQTGVDLWSDVPLGTAMPSSGPTPTPAPLLPATNFEIKVSTVYRDDGTLTPGTPLIVGVLGRLNSADTDQVRHAAA